MLELVLVLIAALTFLLLAMVAPVARKVAQTWLAHFRAARNREAGLVRASALATFALVLSAVAFAASYWARCRMYSRQFAQQRGAMDLSVVWIAVGIVIAVLMIPIIIDTIVTVHNNTNISLFTGLDSLLLLIPLIFVVAVVYVIVTRNKGGMR